MYIRHPGLGLIPAWSFSMDPNQNPKLNPFVTFPPGVTQQTAQPIGPYYVSPDGTTKPGIAGSAIRSNRRGGLLGLGAVALGCGMLGLALLGRR